MQNGPDIIVTESHGAGVMVIWQNSGRRDFVPGPRDDPRSSQWKHVEKTESSRNFRKVLNRVGTNVNPLIDDGACDIGQAGTNGHGRVLRSIKRRTYDDSFGISIWYSIGAFVGL